MAKEDNKFRIGILGGGFVGSAVSFGFASSNDYDFDVKIYDVDLNKSTHSLKDTVCNSDFIFLCLPTPSREDMSIDLSYIEKAMEDISPYIDSFTQTLIIKSTVVAGTCRRLSKKYGINIVSNPEFLTERRAKWDFINAAQVVIGSDEKEGAVKLKSLYEKRFTSMQYLITDTVTAEFTKYLLNCFFSVKVGFMNEMYQVAQNCSVDWESAVKGMIGDCRVADSHVKVPGPDGSLGFGGHCFPKDLNALINFAERLGVEPTIMKATWEKNKELRSINK